MTGFLIGEDIYAAADEAAVVTEEFIEMALPALTRDLVLWLRLL